MCSAPQHAIIRPLPYRMDGSKVPLRFSDAPEVNTHDGIEFEKPAYTIVHEQIELFEKSSPAVRQGTICGENLPSSCL